MEPRILIVGAGPTGLMLALQLAHHQVPFRIVDKHASPLELTKAAAIHARALELLRDVGAVEPVLDMGQRVDILDLRTDYTDRIRVDFGVLGDTRFAYMIDLPQYRTEQVMIDRLADLGIEVEREVTLEGLTQDPDEVTVRLVTADGAVEVTTFDQVAACDGANSTIRDLVGQEFKGDSYAEPWVLCDAELDWPLPRNEMTFSSDAQGIMGVFPLPGEQRYRIAYTQHITADGTPIEPDVGDAQTALTRTGLPGRIRSTTEFWTFNLDHRQVEDFSVGRVHLVGDAAHVHTPFGGQGMNLGLGDATNLAWKLAATLEGTAAPGLLASYAAERHAIGSQVVARTHLGAEAMLLRDGPLATVRDIVMGTAGSRRTPMRFAARWLSQLAHTYRTHEVRPGLRDGDRLPDQPFFDAVTDRRLCLHDLADPTKHTVVVHVGDDPDAAARVETGRQLVPAALAGHVDVLTVASDVAAMRGAKDLVVDREGRLSAHAGRGPTAHVVRPDRHLSATHLPATAAAVGQALRRTTTASAPAHA